MMGLFLAEKNQKGLFKKIEKFLRAIKISFNVSRII
jgi:hypothetical protein